HELEAIGQHGGRDSLERSLQVLEAARSLEEVAHDQERPAVAHELERLRDGTGLAVALGHPPHCNAGRPALTKDSNYVKSSDMAIADAAPLAARTRRLLERPIVPTLLALAAPNVLVMVVQAAVTVADAFYVGRLGA